MMSNLLDKITGDCWSTMEGVPYRCTRQLVIKTFQVQCSSVAVVVSLKGPL